MKRKGDDTWWRHDISDIPEESLVIAKTSQFWKAFLIHNAVTDSMNWQDEQAKNKTTGLDWITDAFCNAFGNIFGPILKLLLPIIVALLIAVFMIGCLIKCIRACLGKFVRSIVWGGIGRRDIVEEEGDTHCEWLHPVGVWDRVQLRPVRVRLPPVGRLRLSPFERSESQYCNILVAPSQPNAVVADQPIREPIP